MRSLKEDSCSEREAAGADAKAFSSSRREMRMGNSTATSCGPAWLKHILSAKQQCHILLTVIVNKILINQ